MFTIDQKITGEDLRERNLFKAFFSMNTHQVATPEMSLEEARSYVFIFREGKKRLSAYIGIHLLLTDRKLYYTQSANPFLEEEFQEIEDEALTFAESLGAMLDEIDLTVMSDSEKRLWINEQGIFVQKKAVEPVAPEPQPEVVSIPAAAPSQPVPVQQQVPVTPPQPVLPVQQAPIPQIQQAPPAITQPAAPVIAEPRPAAVSIPRETEAPAAAVTPAYEPQEQPYQKSPAPVTSSKPLAARAMKRQEILQKAAAHAGSAPPSRKPSTMETPSSTGVVSRDREALARLLTSF